MPIIAYFTLASTVLIVVFSPRVFSRWTLGPAFAGISAALVLVSTGVVSLSDIAHAIVLHWRPFVMIISTLIIATIAEDTGVLDRIADRLFRAPNLTPARLFFRVFVLCSTVATLFNNDQMVLLMTPLVLTFIKRRYPARHDLLTPFAFAVFMAIGVAPMYISNPMNMIGAEFAHVNFNQYVVAMLPCALAGWVVTYPLIRLFFRGQLQDTSGAMVADDTQVTPPSSEHFVIYLILAAVILGYPTVAYFDGNGVWMIAASGAVASVLLGVWSNHTTVLRVIVRNAPWDIFIFLLGVYVISIGLRNVGFTQLLASAYQGANLFVIGYVSAIGSALINNHPMSLINLMTLQSMPTAGRNEVFAALIGGDIGPRILPGGSLAGLLWVAACQRQGLRISLHTFVVLGILTTIPTIAISIWLLT